MLPIEVLIIFIDIILHICLDYCNTRLSLLHLEYELQLWLSSDTECDIYHLVIKQIVIGLIRLFNNLVEVQPHLHFDKSGILSLLVHEDVIALDCKILHGGLTVVINIEELLIEDIDLVEAI